MNRVPLILLIEDNPADQIIFTSTLEGNPSVQLKLARDGEEALSFLRRSDAERGFSLPDLVVLDLNLPKVDGREVLQEMKRDTSLRAIPIIILSSSKDEEEVLWCYSMGASCYLKKVPDLDQYTDLVRSLIAFWLGRVELPERKRR